MTDNHGWYMGWSKDTDPEIARKKFFDVYGAFPEKVFVEGQALKAGPIPVTTTPPALVRHAAKPTHQPTQPQQEAFDL